MWPTPPHRRQTTWLGADEVDDLLVVGTLVRRQIGSELWATGPGWYDGCTAAGWRGHAHPGVQPAFGAETTAAECWGTAIASGMPCAKYAKSRAT
ncbi:hypothetical protein MRX96_022056 [Rhipicephalus microplus]